jgi:Asp-tRNA(Asn)/Glu-tRNA(Gln) amidotransferase A subunit family amidase
MLPSPWKQDLYDTYSTKKKLRFAYYYDDGITIGSPPTQRAILETLAALKAQGHELVHIAPPYAVELFHTFIAITSAEGYFSHLMYLIHRYYDLRNPIRPDPMEQTLRFTFTVAGFPRWIRSTLSFILRHIVGDSFAADTADVAGRKTASEINTWANKRNKLRDLMNDWMRENEFDGIIAPTSSIPAAPINSTNMTTALAATTFIYNVLDWPAAVIPVTKVKPDEEMEESRFKGREGYSWVFMNRIYGKGNMYSEIMEKGVGLPVGIQVRFYFIELIIGYFLPVCW